MRANPSSKALAVLLAVLASAVSSARAKQLRATAADEQIYSDKKNKGDKGAVVDSNDEPGRRRPGPSYGRAVQDLFGSVPVQVETRCSDGHEYRLISPEHCKPSLGGGGSSRNLQPGGGAKGNPDCSCVQTTLPPESANAASARRTAASAASAGRSRFPPTRSSPSGWTSTRASRSATGDAEGNPRTVANAFNSMLAAPPLRKRSLAGTG
ncbi:hypothetical protein THAOC_12573, partial [Thalassiosira oceanica]